MPKMKKLDLILDLVFSLPFIAITALFSFSGPIIIIIGTIMASRYRLKIEQAIIAEPNQHPILTFSRRVFMFFSSRAAQQAAIIIGLFVGAIEYTLLH